MLKKLNLCFIALFALLANVKAQTVSISSPDEVCKNELISFQATTTGTVASYSWDFGDNSSSNQQNPSHIYTNTGAIQVSLTVNFSGGGSQKATKSITVHDLPTADFTVENSTFCFSSQDVCITDNSTMGTTTNGYASRLILWGDGAQTTSNFPSSNKVTCYSDYPQPSSSAYTIIAEVVNDKGCEDKWQEDIYIIEDYTPRFTYDRDQALCDIQRVCFENDSVTKSSDIQSFEWDFGDGSATNTTDWGAVCHNYTKSGAYRAKLTVTFKNGCVSTFSRVFSINIFKFTAEVTATDTVKCYPENITLATPLISAAIYSWQLFDLDTNYLEKAGSGIVQGIGVPCPGDYLVRVFVKVGNCTKASRFVRIKSEGVGASFIALNKQQCLPFDTVYTLNRSKLHPEANPVYTWDFGDSSAAKCTGWRSNCNFDNEEHSRHWYTEKDCFGVRLKAVDLTSGCETEAFDSVSILDPSTLEYELNLGRPCIGVKKEYGVRISHNMCDGYFEVCPDSLADDSIFYLLQGLIYQTVADSNGWVTIGLASRFGLDTVYHSSSLTDYTIEPDNICRDTVWFHHWFQLHPEPIRDIERIQDTTCLPIFTTLKYTGDEEGKLSKMSVRWNANLNFEEALKEKDTIPDLTHLYTEEGRKFIDVILEDTFGCYSTTRYANLLGFHNSFRHPPVICVDKEVIFVDSVRYYQDNSAYWRNPGATETMSWDFGEGNGFTATGPLPTHSYSSMGNYLVRMSTKDGNGCTDTAYSAIQVGNIFAAIEDNSEDYLCDQIVQFFDSSYFSFANAQDEVISYYWDFGDSTKESLLQNPYHYYSRNGLFNITLAVETKAGCKDTAVIPIYLKGPEPDFDFVTDSVGCVPFTVKLKSNSKNVSSFNWFMGDDKNTIISESKDTTISFTYNQPGTYYIFLEGSDSFYNADAQNTYTCTALYPDTLSKQALRKVVVLPIPQASFLVDDPVCLGRSTIFRSTSDSAYEEFNWTIDGEEGYTGENLVFAFMETGIHTINLKPTYDASGLDERECFDSASNSVLVSEVKANFGFYSQGLCSEYVFSDSSENAIEIYWDFDHPTSDDANNSTEPNPIHRYGKDSGEYKVRLVAVNKEGCTDTMYQTIQIDYVKELTLYNVFTPNQDGKNDVFLLDMENVKSYALSIYNRYGERVFFSHNPFEGWNGKMDNVGDELPASTYYYVLEYIYNCETTERDAEGMVELIRK